MPAGIDDRRAHTPREGRDGGGCHRRRVGTGAGLSIRKKRFTRIFVDRTLREADICVGAGDRGTWRPIYGGRCVSVRYTLSLVAPINLIERDVAESTVAAL